MVQRWLDPWTQRRAGPNASRAERIYELLEPNATATYPLDLSEAVASGLSDNATSRIGMMDNIHLNPAGRRFTGQFLLNLIRMLLPPLPSGGNTR